jgi:Protein of unknown function (DUF3048) N-terminal domain/Protein of unknown function (DUF3048) C-terminal domain
LALTRRGKAFVTGGTVAAILAIGLATLALTGNAPGPIQAAVDAVTGQDHTPPPPCPLTGKMPAGGKGVPGRPALAVKVENTSDAYPLAGIGHADIVYEEVVEGGITRFIAVFQCQDAPRVGPVRSARTTDPKILLQFNRHPLLAFSGGAPKVVNIVRQAGVVEMTEGDPAAAFTRDPNRAVPHNLFTNTRRLWVAGHKRAKGEPAPRPVFTYDPAVPKPSKAVSSATIVFSGLATADWHWEHGKWVRYLDGTPMSLDGAGPIATDNVVIQQVKVTQSDITDVAGYPSPEVTVTGKGKAWVLRNGRLIAGSWSRPSENDLTVFTTKGGDTITLKPGTTYVELAPTGMFDAQITFGK